MSHILHICNDFSGSKVHAALYAALDGLGLSQTVYTYIKDAAKEGRNAFKGEHTAIIYSHALRPFHRYLYHLKLHTLLRDMEQRADLSQVTFVHATTLFSDGGLAYRLYRRYGLPYAVAVRNTDVNYFLRLAPHTWSTGRAVLRHASRIVFISKALQETFCKHPVVRSLLPEIASRMVVQPNGIDEAWLSDIYAPAQPASMDVVYVGKFDSGKNVLRLIDAFNALRPKFPQSRLRLIGGGGSAHEAVMQRVKQMEGRVEFLGPIYDKARLKEIFRECAVFAMPSIYETFGLVYVEALSQGLPILFTRGQGVDGYFAADAGVGVDAHSTDSIAQGLETLLADRKQYDGYRRVDFSAFRWPQIARRYVDEIFVV